MIKNATENDFDEIYNIINDAAIAYKGIIPADRWHEPYMSKKELKSQIDEGVIFSCYFDGKEIIGVMGIQNKNKVNLIRHAYVKTNKRNKGVGTILLEKLINSSKKPILIGTWKAASWAISFYEKYGFQLVPEKEKNLLLNHFWEIPERQVETSVVLADANYRNRKCMSFG